jgi:hypothetical protein
MCAAHIATISSHMKGVEKCCDLHFYPGAEFGGV